MTLYEILEEVREISTEIPYSPDGRHIRLKDKMKKLELELQLFILEKELVAKKDPMM